ncbi:MAG: hypothetical protein JO145_16870 [Acidobacteriaceae bacterium]|nr:hypothetical protein [Acidobacteriaceae bacterium]MBV9763526.1 hypothetical protein [Acidobacteriaceae bacterium]
MRSSVAVALLLLSLVARAQWQPALPGYQYHFPRDHFSHPDYQTEWWYYTGNLRAPDGHRFGFELTFFREAVDLSKQQIASSSEIWRPDQIYLAHLAWSDIDGGQFYHTERLNRSGPGLAGVNMDQQRYWNGNWQVRWISKTGEQELKAVCDRFTLQLNLGPEKPLVIHGHDGVSRKGPAPGEASHYISFTRIHARGEVRRADSSVSVEGLAWMDHEFFTEQLGSTVSGWDWFAVQLNNDEELMLYRLRTKSGQPDPYSSGTYVDAHGEAHFLDAAEFSLTPAEYWRSRASGAHYPVSWRISVPSLQLEIQEATALKNQELFSKDGISPSYWEGAVTYDGSSHGRAVRGVGYLEMTGYAKALQLGR